MSYASELRKMIRVLNKEVFNSELDACTIRVRTCSKFIEGYAVGMCEWNETKQAFILTFSKEIPPHWVNDWEKRAWALVCHEMAHIYQFQFGDKHLANHNKKTYNVHDSRIFKNFGKKFHRVTGIPLAYFGMNGEIE